MRTRTLREFCNDTAKLVRSGKPILVTHRGRIAGIFWPMPQATVPMALKRELFGLLSSEIARQLKRRGLKEDEIAADFDSWRSNKSKAVRGSRLSGF
jgi:hypothetical protein